MSIKMFMYFPGSKIEGETQDQSLKKLKAFDVLSFELGGENNVNIGSISSGGGAGKAQFKGFSISKRTDTASCELWKALCTGEHIDDAILEVHHTIGDRKTSAPFMKYSFKLVMVQDITNDGSEGSDSIYENYVFQYGAMKINYSQTKMDGKKSESKEFVWNQVKNNASFKAK